MTVLCFCSLLKLPVFVNIGEIQQRLLNSAEKHRALAKSVPDWGLLLVTIMEWLYFAGNKWNRVITGKKVSVVATNNCYISRPLFGKRNLENLCRVKIAIRKSRAITETGNWGNLEHESVLYLRRLLFSNVTINQHHKWFTTC